SLHDALPIYSRDLGSIERSSYHLIPEFRGARAQWKFTDLLITSNRFQGSPSSPPYKYDPPMANLSGTRNWSWRGRGRGVRWTIRVACIAITLHHCRASLIMWVFGVYVC